MNTTLLRDLVVLPLRAIVYAVSMTDASRTTHLRYRIWRVTRTPDDAISVVLSVMRNDRDRAREFITEIVETTRDCEHLALLATIDHGYTGDSQWVQSLIDQARAAGYAQEKYLAFLELILVEPKQEPERTIELADRLLSGGDVRPKVSEIALYNRFLALLHIGRLADAEAIVTRMLSIEASLLSVAMAISLRLARGDDTVDDLLALLPVKPVGVRDRTLAIARANVGYTAEQTLEQAEDGR